MRLKFKKGKQKTLIKNFKRSKRITWNELSNFLGIKSGKLKAYVDETSLITKEIYEKLDPYREFLNT